MMPLFFSKQEKPKNVTDVSRWNTTLSSLLNGFISPNISALSSLYFCYFICHSCWNLLSKIIHGINHKHSDLIIWPDSLDLVSCIVFLDLSGWQNMKKALESLRVDKWTVTIYTLFACASTSCNSQEGFFSLVFCCWFLTSFCQPNALFVVVVVWFDFVGFFFPSLCLSMIGKKSSLFLK